MLKSGYNGRLFEFETTYFDHPLPMEFVKVWQIGELSTEPGYEMPTHLQICHEISYVVSGQGIFYTDGTALPAKQGDIHVVPAGKTHRIVAEKNQNLRFAYIGFEFIEEFERQDLRDIMRIFADPPSYLIRDTGDVRTLIYMLINEMYSKPVFNDIMVECYIKEILIQIYRLLLSVRPNVFVPREGQKMIGQSVYSIIRYIDNNIFEIDSVRGIAENLGYSHSYLSHLFREKMGTTLQAYVSMKKIEASLDLLKYKKSSITQIASALNYESAQSFGKVFKKIMGCSPTEYQRRYDSAQTPENRKGGEES